jgi:hypothetical protein
MPYGTQQQVATMASTWTDDGVWTEYTNPTLLEVQDWLDQVSAQFNIALGSHYFVPSSVSATDTPNAYKSIAQQVVNLVADLVNFKNSSGRYFTEKLVERGITPMAATHRDINAWIELNADGLVADGVQQLVKPSSRKAAYFRVLG